MPSFQFSAPLHQSVDPLRQFTFQVHPVEELLALSATVW
jgi:hypothetical protein